MAIDSHTVVRLLKDQVSTLLSPPNITDLRNVLLDFFNIDITDLPGARALQPARRPWAAC